VIEKILKYLENKLAIPEQVDQIDTKQIKTENDTSILEDQSKIAGEI
jgi:hypothetical protein